MAKVTRRKARPDEKFLGDSGVVILRGLTPSKNKQVKNSKESPETKKEQD